MLQKKILIDFYQFAGLEAPEWIEYFVEQRDAIDESNEKTQFALRAFLVNKINDVFRHNCRDPTGFEDIHYKLEYCLNRNLIPFLHLIKKEKESKDCLVITHDIFDEINEKWSKIENITSLKDIGSQIGFEYDSKWVNKKRMRLLSGSISTLKEFLHPEFSHHGTMEQ